MEKYSGTETCPKCTTMDIGVRYDKERDALYLNCKRCEYTWRVKPADAKDA